MLCDNLDGWENVGWERDLGERGPMYTYGRFMLVYGRNQHIIKQLYSI